MQVSLELRRGRRATDPTVQSNELHRVLAGNPLNLVDVWLSCGMNSQVEAINAAIGDLASIENSLLIVRGVTLFGILLIVLVIIFRLDRRQPFLAANAKPVERPANA